MGVTVSPSPMVKMSPGSEKMGLWLETNMGHSRIFAQLGETMGRKVLGVRNLWP